MTLQLPIRSQKACFGLDPVLRCEPSTYRLISLCHNHCNIKASFFDYKIMKHYLCVCVCVCVVVGGGGGGEADKAGTGL